MGLRTNSFAGATRRAFLGGTGGALLGAAAPPRGPDDLQTITQALVDALAPGRGEIWAHWTHPEFVVTDENGVRTERRQFLDGIRPLPPGASGTIRVKDFNAKRVGKTQVTTYALEELEQFHGEELRARYRQTDTWVRDALGWQLLASQVIALRTDPPAIQIPATLLSEYAGRYHLPDGLALEIAANGASATLRKGTSAARPLKAELVDLLFVPGDPRIRYLVQRNGDGRVTGLIQRRESWDIVWTRDA